MIRKRILVVDDDESLRWVTQAQLQQSGYHVDAAANAKEALAWIHENPPDLVITDLMMPGMSGIELLKSIRTDYPEIIVILVTAFGTVENAVEAMKAGAYDYITKPVNVEELRLIVGRGLEHLDLRQEVRNLRSSLDKKYGFENILGQSKPLLYVARHGGARRQRDVHGTDSRRNRHGKRTAGEGHPLQQPAQGQAIRHDQLRRDSERPARV
ncbi:MAG: response regulator [Ignavibacteriota bacterium]